MKQYFAYVRVSTQRQGEHGSSLQEQRAAIEAFAQRERLTISEWFEERETAAKIGRTVFRRMFALLDKGKAHGVVMHKIDRGARNLSDWADLAKLLDKGIEVRFANDNLDMTSRGGRLAADIQAVVAADYIRNLREEVIKGLYGRLKQGFYPLKAPLGYLDNGSAKHKTICPTVGPHVRDAFVLYATGNYSLRTLAAELTRRGITGQRGKQLTANRLSTILANPFYYGLMKIKRNGQSFVGTHEPLISKALFDRVQARKSGQIKVKTGIRHAYTLQRMIRCTTCTRSLYAEKHKGRIYYRCQTRGCSSSIREDRAFSAIASTFAHAGIDDAVITRMHEALDYVTRGAQDGMSRRLADITLMLDQLREREARLTDAYLDQAIDGTTLHERRATLNNQRIALDQERVALEKPEVLAHRGTTFLELVEMLKNLDNQENIDRVREICRTSILNFTARGNNLAIAWDSPFSMLFSDGGVRLGGQQRDKPVGSGSVQNEFGGPVNPETIQATWTTDRIHEVLQAVVLGRCEDTQPTPNIVPISPRLTLPDAHSKDAQPRDIGQQP